MIAEIEINIEQQNLINSSLAWEYRIVPKKKNDFLHLYIDQEIFNEKLQKELEIVLGKDIKFVEAEKIVIQKALVKYYKRVSDIGAIKSYDKDFLEKIIKEAKYHNSSDRCV